MGIKHVQQGESHADEMLITAENALHQAKQQGGNRVQTVDKNQRPPRVRARITAGHPPKRIYPLLPTAYQFNHPGRSGGRGLSPLEPSQARRAGACTFY